LQAAHDKEWHAAQEKEAQLQQLQQQLQAMSSSQSHPQDDLDLASSKSLPLPSNIFQVWQEAASQQFQGLETSAALQMQTFTESVKSNLGNLGAMETVVGSKNFPPPSEDEDDAPTISSIQSMKFFGNSGGLTSEPSQVKATPDDDYRPRATSVLSIQSMKDSIVSKFGNSGGLTSEPQDNGSSLPSPPEDDYDDIKFSMAQRIESAKCLAAGALGGGLAVAPVTYLHSAMVSSNVMAQWELWTDMASLQAALFAIVYRYVVREDENPMLNQGVIGAFVLARTLLAIQVSETCTAVPLICKYL
jgi:hypothetical protein